MLVEASIFIYEVPNFIIYRRISNFYIIKIMVEPSKNNWLHLAQPGSLVAKVETLK